MTAAAASADDVVGPDSVPVDADPRQGGAAVAEAGIGAERGRQTRRAPGIQGLAKTWSPAAAGPAQAQTAAVVLKERWAPDVDFTRTV